MNIKIDTCWIAPAAMEKYLQPSPLVDSDSEVVIETTRRIIYGINTQHTAVRMIFHYVRDDIRYARIPLDSNASEVIRRKVGNCTNKSTVFVAMCRAAGIPAQLHYYSVLLEGIKCLLHPLVVPLSPRVFDLNCRADVFLDGRWITLETEFDPELYRGLLKRKLIQPMNIDWDGENSTKFLEPWVVGEIGTFLSPAEPVRKFHDSIGWKRAFLPFFYWLCNLYIDQSRQMGRL